MRETGGGAEQALARAEQGLAAVLRAVETGADLDGLRLAVSHALGTTSSSLFAEGEARPAGAASRTGTPARSACRSSWATR